MSRAPRWGRARIPTTSSAPSSGSTAQTGEAKTLYTECDGHKLSRAERPGVRQAGGFYFTDLGKRYARHRDHGGLYYALPDGSKIVAWPFPC